MVVKIGIIKIGNIGASPVIDLILDERADRDDIDVRTIGSGSKMGKKQIDDLLPKINDFNPNLIIFITPNPNAKQPKKALNILSKVDVPTVVIGDSPGEKAIDLMEEQKLGYVLIRADPMIGARREFLDPTEMVLFNADVLKVLSITGVFRLLHNLIDKLIYGIINNEIIELPKLVVTAKKAISFAGFKNPYAMSKALAAYHIATKVSEMDICACFKTNDADTYIPLVSAAHEMMTIAARLADEAREIEKSNDTVLRTSHKRDGSILNRISLMDKYE